MWFVGAEEEAEGLLLFRAILHEGIDFVEVGVFTVGDLFPRENLARRDVGLAALGDAVAQGFEILDDALGVIFDVGVVGVGATGDGIKSGVDVVPGRRAHWCCLETTGEAHSFAGELIDIGSVGLAAVASEITEGAIVGDDKDDVGFCREGKRTRQE